MEKRKHIRFLVLSAIAAAILSLFCPLVLPIGTVGVTLATAILLLYALSLRPSVAVTATAVYLAVGALGLPVFSHFSGGLAAFSSPSGGFLIGYLPFVTTVVLLRKASDRLFMTFLSIVLAHLALYACGAAVFAAVTHVSFGRAVVLSVVPFLLPDAIKAAVGIYLAGVIRRRALHL